MLVMIIFDAAFLDKLDKPTEQEAFNEYILLGGGQDPLHLVAGDASSKTFDSKDLRDDFRCQEP